MHMDRYLDEARTGPLWLAQEPVARAVRATIIRGAKELKYYDLGAYVVMPNHVHLLVTPIALPSKFMQSLKGLTAREANRILDRTGEAFWQAESYDCGVRDLIQWHRIKSYIENHPVKAGLVKCAEQYRWSSAAG
jgi:putative transposase